MILVFQSIPVQQIQMFKISPNTRIITWFLTYSIKLSSPQLCSFRNICHWHIQEPWGVWLWPLLHRTLSPPQGLSLPDANQPNFLVICLSEQKHCHFNKCCCLHQLCADWSFISFHHSCISTTWSVVLFLQPTFPFTCTHTPKAVALINQSLSYTVI